jgi:hypothetical protein
MSVEPLPISNEGWIKGYTSGQPLINFFERIGGTT